MKKLIAVAVLTFAAGALADKTVTYLSAGVAVDTMSFHFGPGADADLNLEASVCGHAPLSGGGNSEPTCYRAAVGTGALRTAVLSLRNGGALTFWRTKESL